MKSKILIVYKSKYGSAKKYAYWITQRTGADSFELSILNRSKLAKYDVILFGSSLHMGKIKGSEFIKQNWEVLKKKKVAIFTVAAASPGDPAQAKAFKSSFPKEIRDQVSYFPLSGAFDYSRLDLGDKLVMNFPRLVWNLKWRLTKNEKTRRFLDCFQKSFDWTNEKAIEPIIAFAKR